MAKRIVLTGGGTAGHVTPHLSLIPRLKEAGYEIHYIGTENGIEHQMIAAIPGITYHSVKSGKLRRYFSLQNFSDPFKVIAGAAESVSLMRKIKPDVVFSKGGFVSVPVVVGAWMCHVPTVCHESDLTPGLANRICAKFAWRVAATFPECAKALGEKGVMTGTPLRPELFQGSRAAGLALAGFDPNVLDERDVHYQCDCSAERTKEMLFSLGRKELVKMRDEDPNCEVVCHFCHSKYQYDLNDLIAEYDAQAAENK